MKSLTGQTAPLSMWDIQQQEAREEERRQREAEAEAERQRQTEAEAAKNKPQWTAAVAAPEPTTQQPAIKTLAEIQAEERAEQERERQRAAAAAKAAQEAKKQQTAAAKLAAAQPKAADLRAIQEEEERRASAAALNEQKSSEEAIWGDSSIIHATPNPMVAWNAPGEKKEKRTTTSQAKTEPAPAPVHMTREQKLAAAKAKREREERERREAEERAARERKEEEERKKREQLERAKLAQKATWGVAPPVAPTDLRAIQAADAQRAAVAEAERMKQLQAMQATQNTSILAKWGGANSKILSLREIQEMESEAQRNQETVAQPSAATAMATNTAFTGAWGGSPIKAPPTAQASRPSAENEEDDIWGSGSQPAVPSPSQPTVAAKLAARLAQSKDTMSRPATQTKTKTATGTAPQSSPTAASSTAASSTRTPSTSAAAATTSSSLSTPAKKERPRENSFGGPQMSLEFEKWCRDQMQKIAGTDDLTLAHFLLTVESRGQIEEYIFETLGRTSETQKFASGFMQRRDQALQKHHAAQHAQLVSPLPASAAAAAAAADKKRRKQKK